MSDARIYLGSGVLVPVTVSTTASDRADGRGPNAQSWTATKPYRYAVSALSTNRLSRFGSGR